MTFQWGKNPEHTIDLFKNLTYWALPLCVYWWNYCDVKENKCFNLEIKFLCFGFSYERWVWYDKT